MEINTFTDKIHIVSSHNEVLLPWAEFRLTTEEKAAPCVLVLDHHTDVKLSLH